MNENVKGYRNNQNYTIFSLYVAFKGLYTFSSLLIYIYIYVYIYIHIYFLKTWGKIDDD